MATVSRDDPGLGAASDGRRSAVLGPVRHRLTVDDYYRMAEAGILGHGERVELIDGEIIDMSPIGALHAAVVNVLVRHFAHEAVEPLPFDMLAGADGPGLRVSFAQLLPTRA